MTTIKDLKEAPYKTNLYQRVNADELTYNERVGAFASDLVKLLKQVRDGKHGKQLPETACDIVYVAHKIYREEFPDDSKSVEELLEEIKAIRGYAGSWTADCPEERTLGILKEINKRCLNILGKYGEK